MPLYDVHLFDSSGHNARNTVRRIAEIKKTSEVLLQQRLGDSNAGIRILETVIDPKDFVSVQILEGVHRILLSANPRWP